MRAHTITCKARVGGGGRLKDRILPRGLAVVLLVVALCAAGSVPAQADWKDAPMVPKLNRADEIQLRHELRQGLERGARADVLAKVGDSNTVDGSFLAPFACSDLHMAGHLQLRETISYFGRTTFDPSSTGVVCARSNSFSRRSAAAGPGWPAHAASDVGVSDARFGCSNTDTPLTCEYRQIHPAWAVVMFGTNDSYFHVTGGSYRDAITALIGSSQRAGVIPIVVTTPPRQGDEEREQMIEEYNRILAAEARERRLPMINLWRGLHRSSMVNWGLRDGTHLNVAPESVLGMPCAPLGCGERALRYGSNLRNLITLRTLQRLHRRVIAPVLHSIAVRRSSGFASR